MNKDISLMIELQGYWDIILRCRADIERSEKSILYWKEQVREKSGEVSGIEGEVKMLRIELKQKEIDLSEKDEQIKKLNHRKDIIKNEKEMTALSHEIDRVAADKDALETDMLQMYDLIEQKEKQITGMKPELEGIEKQATADIQSLENEISHLKEMINENQQRIDKSADSLTPLVKTKFLKLLKSQNGKGVAAIEGSNCGACNFQIPFNLVQDAIKENSIVTCTNCGRFLYIAADR